MSIDSIGTNISALTTTQFSNVSSVNSARQDGDADDQGPRKAGGGGRVGKFREAINDALAQLGVSASAATGSSDTTGLTGTGAAASADSGSDVTASKTPKQALDAFVQSLFAALHAQSQTSQPPQEGAAISSFAGAGSTGTASASAATGTHAHRHGGGVGKLEGDLQNLIKELSASTSPTATTTDATATATSSTALGITGTDNSGSSTSSPVLTQLQQSFSALLSADGAAGSTTSLGNFLQALSQNFHGAPASGNIVNTKA